MLDVLLDAEPVSQVVFIHDYIQLVFQGTYLSLYNRVRISHTGSTFTDSDSGFADRFRALIGKRVVHTSSVERQFSSFTFEDGTVVVVSLEQADIRGPEALEIGDDKGMCIVEQNL